jgi:hypothetical protein
LKIIGITFDTKYKVRTRKLKGVIIAMTDLRTLNNNATDSRVFYVQNTRGYYIIEFSLNHNQTTRDAS